MLFHLLLIISREDTCAAAGTDKGADRVESIGQRESENGDENQRQTCWVSEKRWETLWCKDSESSFWQLLERLYDADGLAHRCEAVRDADKRGYRDSDYESALVEPCELSWELNDEQNDSNDEANKEDLQLRVCERGERRSARFEVNDLNIEQANVSDKDTDTAANSVLKHWRNGLNNHLTQGCSGNNNVNNAANKYHRHGFLPRKTNTFHNSEGEEGVETHTWS